MDNRVTAPRLRMRVKSVTHISDVIGKAGYPVANRRTKFHSDRVVKGVTIAYVLSNRPQMAHNFRFVTCRISFTISLVMGPIHIGAIGIHVTRS